MKYVKDNFLFGNYFEIRRDCCYSFAKFDRKKYFGTEKTKILNIYYY